MDCIFLRICYTVEEAIPQPSSLLLDPMRKKAMCASTVQPQFLGRAQGARQPKGRAGGEEEDAAPPFSAPNTVSPHLSPSTEI